MERVRFVQALCESVSIRVHPWFKRSPAEVSLTRELKSCNYKPTLGRRADKNRCRVGSSSAASPELTNETRATIPPDSDGPAFDSIDSAHARSNQRPRFPDRLLGVYRRCPDGSPATAQDQ